MKIAATLFQHAMDIKLLSRKGGASLKPNLVTSLAPQRYAEREAIRRLTSSA